MCRCAQIWRSRTRAAYTRKRRTASWRKNNDYGPLSYKVSWMSEGMARRYYSCCSPNNYEVCWMCKWIYKCTQSGVLQSLLVALLCTFCDAPYCRVHVRSFTYTDARARAHTHTCICTFVRNYTLLISIQTKICPYTHVVTHPFACTHIVTEINYIYIYCNMHIFLFVFFLTFNRQIVMF